MIVDFFFPLAGEELDNGRVALQEFVAVAPDTILCIGGHDFLWIAGVPQILGELHFLPGGFEREGWGEHGFFSPEKVGLEGNFQPHRDLSSFTYAMRIHDREIDLGFEGFVEIVGEGIQRHMR